MSIKIEKLHTHLINFFQLSVDCVASGEKLQFAYYLYKDHEIVELKL